MPGDLSTVQLKLDLEVTLIELTTVLLVPEHEFFSLYNKPPSLCSCRKGWNRQSTINEHEGGVILECTIFGPFQSNELEK